MWLAYAFLSAALLGCYDVCKKLALRHQAVVPVLFLNTFFCSLIFLVPVLGSAAGWIGQGSLLYVPSQGWAVQRYVVLKSLIVLSSWILGYYGMKYLPLTLVGPINATRPVMVLLGAMLFFGERLNLYQWVGVLLAIASFYLLSRSGRREGIDFRHNRWVACVVLAAVLGALSGLYDKYLMAAPEAGGVGLNRMVVQSYYNFYQCLLMGLVLLGEYFLAGRRDEKSPGSGDALATGGYRLWSRSSLLPIVLVSLFLSVADFVYFYALSLDGAMVSIVSMVRRSSVVVSFLLGAWLFHERNLRSKAIDLALVLLGMVFLWLGSGD